LGGAVNDSDVDDELRFRVARGSLGRCVVALLRDSRCMRVRIGASSGIGVLRASSTRTNALFAEGRAR
jgi:hypothetical protein